MQQSASKRKKFSKSLTPPTSQKLKDAERPSKIAEGAAMAAVVAHASRVSIFHNVSHHRQVHFASFAMLSCGASALACCCFVL